MPEVTAKQLHEAERAYATARDSTERWRERRNALIREARKAGWTLAQIREATGLTRGRISQIADS